MDWTELIAWIGWAATVGVAWWNGWRPGVLKPPDLSPHKAQLVNAEGRLDGVRTFAGPPPPAIESRAGRYVLDRRAQGPHFTYRMTR